VLCCPCHRRGRKEGVSTSLPPLNRLDLDDGWCRADLDSSRWPARPSPPASMGHGGRRVPSAAAPCPWASRWRRWPNRRPQVTRIRSRSLPPRDSGNFIRRVAPVVHRQLINSDCHPPVLASASHIMVSSLQIHGWDDGTDDPTDAGGQAAAVVLAC
jgi:hypothetical protein